MLWIGVVSGDDSLQGKEPGKAVPVRTFIRKDGALFQPVEITLGNHGSGGVAVTTVAGEEVDRRMV